MASIDDFVNHRWTDAKEVLRSLDGDFVYKLELEVRLENSGLEAPWNSVVDEKPSQRLPSEWHRLLEACVELNIQVPNVQVAAANMTSQANLVLSDREIGKYVLYHLRSWFIHVAALAERTNDVINKCTEVYIPDPKKDLRVEIAKRHRSKVYEQITRRVNQQRNEFVHPRRSWGSGVTEDQLWEKLVSGGMIPSKLLAEFHYPETGTNAKRGKYNLFIGETTKVIDCVGAILQELEADLTNQD